MLLKTQIFLLIFVVGTVIGAPASPVDRPPYYNCTYPLTRPVVSEHETRYRIGIIADLDKASLVKKGEFLWKSNFMKGWLVMENKDGKTLPKKIEWDEKILEFKTDISQKGKGNELSELLVFNGKLYSCGDKTGIVYELNEEDPHPIPFVRLNSGDGHTSMGFKCEWMTVKDDLMYVGSFGTEWMTKDGKVDNKDLMWVKVVDQFGLVKSEDWIKNYDALRDAAGLKFPGYISNEAVNWSKQRGKWFFLPRKMSETTYVEEEDETKGTNKLFTTDEAFKDIKEKDIGPLENTKGFASFKFVPGTDDKIFIALKSVEVKKKTETWVGVYDVDGEVLLKSEKVSDDKFEGVEFI